jgi:hypothetical protein
MAQLPNSGHIIQQIGDDVIIFERYTERELIRFDARDGNATAYAQKAIYELEELDPEDKCFAHFWSGYFYAFSSTR